MIDLGWVRPGSSIRIPFTTFASDGTNATATNFTTADVLIYKDGSTTERGTGGYSVVADFDAKTGRHAIQIDLANNSDASFFQGGSEYLVGIDSITVDGKNVGIWIARFRVGYDGAMLNTIASVVNSQTSFTLLSGPAEDDALNGCEAIIHDVASAVQLSRVLIADYTGSTKTVTLVGPPSFTMTANDNVAVLGLSPLTPTVIGRTLDVTGSGAAGIDWGNVENASTTVGLSGTTVKTATDVETDTADIQARIPAALVNGRIRGHVEGLAGNVITAAAISDDAITVAAIADDAITAAKLATGAITSATFASGAITAASIATDAIGALELGADSVDEIKTAIGTLLTATAALPSGVPPDSVSLADALRYVYQAILCRKDVTGAYLSQYNAAGSVQWKHALTDNGATFTQAKAEAP